MQLLSERRLARINRAVVSGRILPFLALATLLITLARRAVGPAVRPDEFDTFGERLWWAAQTVTTVGYGDVMPPRPAVSKFVAVFVMFFGVAAVSIITAIVTSALIACVRSADSPPCHADEDPHSSRCSRGSSSGWTRSSAP